MPWCTAVNSAARAYPQGAYAPELKRITAPIPAVTKCTILRIQELTSGCKLHRVTPMELASLKLNSEMHYIFVIFEHHPISPLTAMVVELKSP